MRRMIFSIGAGVVLLCVFSCGIFTPRKVEDPGKDTFIDPFRLYSILDKTGEQFSKTSYEDILDTDFKFKGWDDIIFNRVDEIEQLKKLQASCNCDSISTVWDTCEGEGLHVIQTETSLTFCRTFFITYYDASKNIIINFTGKVEFLLNRFSGNVWKIVSWTEEGGTRSIFHP